MSMLVWLDMILSSIEAVVLLFVIVASFKKVRDGGKVWVLFFSVSMVALLLSDVYYVTYSFIRPDMRLPFAFDEIAECSMLLLLSAGLESINTGKKKKDIKILIFSVIYLAFHIVIWIAWSGEWVQDIVFGIPYIYLFYLLVTGIRKTGAFSKAENIGFLILSVITFIVATGEIICDRNGYEAAFPYFNIGVYSAAVIMEFALLFKAIKTIKEKTCGYRSLYVSILFFFMTLLDIYITDGAVYIFNNLFLVIAPAVMYFAIKKELDENDLH